MSQQIICDRCGATIPPKKPAMEIIIRDASWGSWCSKATKHDLCKSCLRKLRRFLKSSFIDIDEEE